MAEALWLAASLAMALCGMGWFALALDPHWKQVFRTDTLDHAAARRLRILGAAALGASLLGCLHVDHASMAILVWILGVSASGILVAMTLAHAPRLLRPLGYPVKALQT